MDHISPELPSDLNLAGVFGGRAEAFARTVAAALKVHMMDTGEQPDPNAWHMDPRVLSAMMALKEDR